MFGRSTSSRFGKESKDQTPGPGDYDAKAVSTTKRGASMGIGARSLVTGTSEFAHLGPGAYSLIGEASFADGRRGAALVRPGAVDFDAAMKKLGASLAKAMGTASGPGAQQKEFNRDDICTMAGKLVADALAASSEAMRLKGELDSINSRVKDEVQAALKPSKSSGNAGNPAAWKLYMPLEKAVDNASSDLAKKLNKLLSFLTTLHEDFPALMVTMADGDRIGQLTQTVETLQGDLDEAIRQAAGASEAAAAAKAAQAAVERELALCRRQLLQQQARADKLDGLMTSHKDILKCLEDQLEASHAQQDETWRQLCNAAQLEKVAAEDGSEQHAQHLAQECKDARDLQEQTMHELHALQAQMTNLIIDAANDRAAMEERVLEAYDMAADAGDDMLSEIDECHALIKQSYRDKRVIRTQVSLLEAKRRALKGCVDAGAAELDALHASLADLDAHPLCLPSPQRLTPEAIAAVSNLDKSATQDVLAGLSKEEELSDALAESQDMLADAALELSRLQREAESRRQESEEIESELRATIDGLMESHHAAEGELRLQLREQHERTARVSVDLAQARDETKALEDQLRDLHASLEHERAQSKSAAAAATALAAAEADRFLASEEELRKQVNAAVAMHSAAVALHGQQVQDLQAQNGAALEGMRSEHALEIGDWQRKLLEEQGRKAELEESLSVAVQELQADKLEHERALQRLKDESDADSVRITQHADAVKAQLCDKLQEAERQHDCLASELQHARDEHEKQCAAANAAREEVERQLAAAESKVEMLGNALKGTEEEKASALAAISNMYQQTDEQLKAMAAGAQAAPHSDSASRARIATLQAELETSMMERSECLQQLEQLQQSAREAAANALKHRERLEMVEAENKALADRVGFLQADNDKLSAENVQLVGHSNLKQRINIFNNVKDENNALKKEKNDAERLVAQQKKVIERLQAQSAIGADKENTCLFAKIDQEEKLQSALKESDKETRSLRKHLLTLLHHVQSSAANTSLATTLKLTGCDETGVGKDILCDSNKAMKQRDWSSDVRETERIIDALTNHLQQQQQQVAGAQLKIHLLEQSARIIAPASGSMAQASVSAGSPRLASFRQKVHA